MSSDPTGRKREFARISTDVTGDRGMRRTRRSESASNDGGTGRDVIGQGLLEKQKSTAAVSELARRLDRSVYSASNLHPVYPSDRVCRSCLSLCIYLPYQKDTLLAHLVAATKCCIAKSKLDAVAATEVGVQALVPLDIYWHGRIRCFLPAEWPLQP